ncbi:MAG: hypothetical protein HYS07_04450 [Chlamydiae bacterium]|nr:hypothetical protein [Chlamydiota bacterium]MBI3277450.1 hypothetical protein [Chlamydiota bacterium]
MRLETGSYGGAVERAERFAGKGEYKKAYEVLLKSVDKKDERIEKLKSLIHFYREKVKSLQ